MNRSLDGGRGRRTALSITLGFATAALGGGAATPAEAADTYACYYNPTEPCYLAQGPFGSERDIKPVSYSFGIGGNGTYAYANNDHGGTVHALAAGGYDSDGGYSASATLTHFISVDLVSGTADALVPLGIQAAAFQPIIGNGGGHGVYRAEQQGRFLAGADKYSGLNEADVLFDINQTVYVIPNVPISIYMVARAGVATKSGDSYSVTVDPIYTIGGDYASRYRLTGLLSNGTGIGAVPEPATWAMMIFGFGAIGMSLRRRGARTALAAASI